MKKFLTAEKTIYNTIIFGLTSTIALILPERPSKVDYISSHSQEQTTLLTENWFVTVKVGREK